MISFKRDPLKFYTAEDIESEILRSEEYWAIREKRLVDMIASQKDELDAIKKKLHEESEDIGFAIETFDIIRSIKCPCKAVSEADSAYWHLYLPRH